ncbi:MAG: hypothetical protein V4793_44615, partial [Paraburkholderia tropica]
CGRRGLIRMSLYVSLQFRLNPPQPASSSEAIMSPTANRPVSPAACGARASVPVVPVTNSRFQRDALHCAASAPEEETHHE